MARFILTLSCPDQPGIVAAVAQLLAHAQCNIIDSAQFGDVEENRFFMRVVFEENPHALQGESALREGLVPLGARFSMEWTLRDAQHKTRTLVMVSKLGHCLNDLLYRVQIGALAIDVPAIVSNHPTLAPLAAAHNIPFYHIPADAPDAEARLEALYQEHACALIVLARYMRILSDGLSTRYLGHIINIHHSFLPSFKGAKPYHQAHARGVKLIGATAHYVTPALDEGPIIEQDVARVHHAMSATDCAAVGRDIECSVLARAVHWHSEHRILINGPKTVVFR